MTQANVNEKKEHLSNLLDSLAQGETSTATPFFSTGNVKNSPSQ
jgi:hypothetical protein